MKVKKIILPILLVLCMLVQPVVFGAEECDLTQNMVEILTTLEIATEEDLASDEIMSKTAFLQYLLKMTDLEEAPKIRIPYSDVLPGSEDADIVSKAYSLGFLTQKSGKFGPSESVTADFVFDTVGNATLYNKAYPDNSSRAAFYRRLFTGVGSIADGELTRKQVLRVMYNILGLNVYKEHRYYFDNVEYVEMKNISLISKYKDIYKIKGRVIANEYASLQGELAGIKNINIDGTVYECDSVTSLKMLGKYVEAYALITEDAKGKILCIVQDYNTAEVLEIDGGNVLGVSGRTLSFVNKNGKTTTEEISKDAAIIYNGSNVAGDQYSETLFDDIDGYVELLYSKDGKCDVVVIFSYDNILINSVNKTDEVIYDKNRSINNLELGGDNVEYVIRTLDGEPFGLEQLAPNMLITYYKSLDEKFVYILVCDESFTGVVSSTTSDKDGVDSLIVNDVEYYTANSALLSSTDIKLGGEYNFYVDAFGKIGALTDKSEINGTIGYVLGVAFESALSGKVNALVLTPDGNEVVYRFADSVTIDGETGLKRAEILSAMKGGVPTFTRIPMIYKLNSNGEIKIVDTPYQNPDPTKEPENSLRKRISVSDGLQYIKTCAGYPFKNVINGKVVVKLSSMVVAEDSNEEAKILPNLPNDKRLTLDVYSISEDSPSCEFVIMTGDSSDSYTLTNNTYVFDSKASVLIDTAEVETHVTLVNKSGETEFVLAEGYENLFDSIDIGDIVRIAEDNFGEIVKVDQIFDYSARKVVTESNPTGAYDLNYAFRLAMGTVYSVKDGTFSFYYPIAGFEQLTAQQQQAAILDKLEASFINEGGLYTYRVERDKLVFAKITADEILPYKTVGSAADIVLMQTTYNTPSSIYIIR